MSLVLLQAPIHMGPMNYTPSPTGVYTFFIYQLKDAEWKESQNNWYPDTIRHCETNPDHRHGRRVCYTWVIRWLWLLFWQAVPQMLCIKEKNKKQTKYIFNGLETLVQVKPLSLLNNMFLKYYVISSFCMKLWTLLKNLFSQPKKMEKNLFKIKL